MGLTSKIRIEIIQFVLVFVNIDDDARPARWSVSLCVIQNKTYAISLLIITYYYIILANKYSFGIGIFDEYLGTNELK